MSRAETAGTKAGTTGGTTAEEPGARAVPEDGGDQDHADQDRGGPNPPVAVRAPGCCGRWGCSAPNW